VFETELRFGIAIAHGFRETQRSLTVTACHGEEVLEFDHRPAAEAYADAMGTTLAELAGKNPTVVTRKLLGVPDIAGQLLPYMARQVTPNGGLLFGRAIPPGTTLSVMLPDPQTGPEAGPSALRTAALRAGIVEPAVAIAAVCPTRLMLFGDAAADEVPRMVKALGGSPLIGFRSWGEQGLTDDGVSNHANGVIAVLLLGKELSRTAQVAGENERLRRSAELVQRRAQQELERQVEERTAELVTANAERTRMMERLMQADRLVAMGRLAGGVGHEINNPLSYVLSGVDAIAEDLAEVELDLPRARLASLRTNLGEVQHGLERIRKAVLDLKTFTRSENEPTRAISVEDALEASLHMASNEMRHRAVVVKEFAPTPRVMGNESRLAQVFLNLLVNAAQAIPEGAASRNQIRVVTRTDPHGQVVVEVRDTGVGIRPEDRDRVFEPYFTTGQLQGRTGLGLSVSQNLIGAMGGSMTVESELGRGSCFRVHLPPAAGHQAATDAAPAEPGRGRILVVDDEPFVLNAVRRILAREHEVVAESSARAALARIAAGEHFDAVVCDLTMPEMGGADFHAALAADHPELAMRTLFLTGGAFTPATRAFVERTPNPFLDKPFDAEVLRAQLRALLNGAARS
jgi:signal transduction histidine kinase/CheY-like chemotaxis protein